MLRPSMTSWEGGLGRVPLALTGQSVRHDESSMVVKQIKYMALVVRKHTSLGKVEDHTET